MSAVEFINYSVYKYLIGLRRDDALAHKLHKRGTRSPLASKLVGLAVLLNVVLIDPVSARKEPSVDLGPQPTMQEYQALVEPAIRQGMLDPGAAQIRFPVGLIRGNNGYWTCIAINGKNVYGGYTGEQFASVGVANGAIAYIVMPNTARGVQIDSECRNRIARGEFPSVE